MTDDELQRRRLAEIGHTPESWEQMLKALDQSEPVEPPPDDEPGVITFMMDGSVWENDEHGVAHQVKPADADRPDAEVHNLDERRRSPDDEDDGRDPGSGV